MKGKAAIVLLTVICIALGVTLLIKNKKASEEQLNAKAELSALAGELAEIKENLDEQRAVNTQLTDDLKSRDQKLNSVSEELETVATTLEITKTKAGEFAETVTQELTEKEQEINKLESEKSEMNSRIGDLTTILSELEVQITETERKLASSEGDREFLLGELNRLQAEKSQLERQLTDLSLLREQIKKLKDELSIARRLEIIRRGLYGTDQKGSEKLQPGFADQVNQTQYDLTVEIREDGDARVVPEGTVPAESPNQE